MRVKRKMSFIFTEENFKFSMDRMPKDEDELNDWADEIIECAGNMIDFDIVYDCVAEDRKDLSNEQADKE